VTTYIENNQLDPNTSHTINLGNFIPPALNALSYYYNEALEITSVGYYVSYGGDDEIYYSISFNTNNNNYIQSGCGVLYQINSPEYFGDSIRVDEIVNLAPFYPQPNLNPDYYVHYYDVFLTNGFFSY